MKKSDIFCWYRSEKSFWFRIFRVGLCFDTEMKFSQRIGKTKYLKIGKYIITFLKPKQR